MLSNAESITQSLRCPGKQLLHLLRGLEIELSIDFALRMRLIYSRQCPHTGEYVLNFVLRFIDVVDVTSGNHRDFELFSYLC